MKLGIIFAMTKVVDSLATSQSNRLFNLFNASTGHKYRKKLADSKVSEAQGHHEAL